MINYARRRILVDGQPRIVIAGEVHYFRVPRDQWTQRLRLAKQAGCDTIASYIPWLVHELPDGSLDVTGGSRPDRDVAAFIDACAAEGLSFIARPGPFIMAELKNEGLPYRLYTEHPEIIPVGWDGKPAPTATVDYLAPAFLSECERWYGAIMPILADRLTTHGGPVIAVQLDNEIGMLAWVSNSPDLTPLAVSQLRSWIRENRADASATYPTLDGTEAEWAASVRTPQEAWAGQLRTDLARFSRTRLARYVRHLRESAERFGVRGIPFLINIHGTEGGGGESFPIGISQLVDTYAGVPGMLSGSDHYVGDMTLNTTTDLYVMNAYQAAVQDADQPVTSIEFEAGTGDYAGGFEHENEPTTVDLKTRWLVAQGTRLVNYYLLAGGINPRLDRPIGDGNDRISFTGERHGTGAPIDPEGRPGTTFAHTQAAIAAIRVMEPWLADAEQELDDLSLGLILDAYATEYVHPSSAVMNAVAGDLRLHRGAGDRRALARSALLLGCRFDATHLERNDVRIGRDGRPALLMVATAQHMDPAVQRRLVDHLDRGGCLLTLGPIPQWDLAGQQCRIFADALGVTPGEILTDGPKCFPSVVAHDWATPLPETRVGWRQSLTVSAGLPILTDVAGEVCGVEVRRGTGTAVLLAAALPSSPVLFARIFDRLRLHRGLQLSWSAPGVFATTTKDSKGNRLLHVLNVGGYQPKVSIRLADLDRTFELRLAPHSGYLLPIGVQVPQGRLTWANAELVDVSTEGLRFGAPAGEHLEYELVSLAEQPTGLG